MTRSTCIALVLALSALATACVEPVPVSPCTADGGAPTALAYDFSTYWVDAVEFCEIQGGRVGTAEEISLACTVHPSGPRIRNGWDCMATDGYVRSDGTPRPGDEEPFYARVACVFGP